MKFEPLFVSQGILEQEQDFEPLVAEKLEGSLPAMERYFLNNVLLNERLLGQGGIETARFVHALGLRVREDTDPLSPAEARVYGETIRDVSLAYGKAIQNHRSVLPAQEASSGCQGLRMSTDLRVDK